MSDITGRFFDSDRHREIKEIDEYETKGCVDYDTDEYETKEYETKGCVDLAACEKLEQQYFDNLLNTPASGYRLSVAEIYGKAFLLACQHERVDIVDLFISKKNINVMDGFEKYLGSTTNEKILNTLFAASSVRNRSDYSSLLEAAIVHNKYELVNKLLNMNVTKLY